MVNPWQTIPTAAGESFEGGLVVEVLDGDGNVLALQPTIIDSPEAGTGGQGPWEVTVDLQGAPDGPGMVVAYATSPMDGSRVAQSAVNVVLGGAGGVLSSIQIEAPAEGAEVDTSQPLTVSGLGQGLFEGNVVVQALDGQGRVVAEQITTAVGENVGTGGPGTWEASLAIPPETSGAGSLRAFSPGATGVVEAEDSRVVTFVSAEAPPGEGGVSVFDHLWLLQELNGGPVLEGTLLTAEFSSAQIVGLAGCNSFNAPWQGSLSSFSLGEASVTRSTCPEPEGVMEQESAYLAALAASTQGEITDGQLVLSSPDGGVILRYAAAVVVQAASGDREFDPQAVVTAQIQDVSVADAPAGIIAEARPPHSGVFPFTFAVTYDPQLIELERAYAVYVRIENAGGELLYATSNLYPVITQGAPRMLTVEMSATR
jgi:heat shock protein HslJ